MENASKVKKPAWVRYSAEVRERAVRMVMEHQHEYNTQGASMWSIASKMGMSRETLRNWVIKAKRDPPQRAGSTTTDLARLKELERENRELRTANELLRNSTIIVRSTGSSRFAGCCRSPRRHIIGTRLSVTTRSFGQHERVFHTKLDKDFAARWTGFSHEAGGCGGILGLFGGSPCTRMKTAFERFGST
ncbi:transposase [Caballeronia sordidicola]|nr:transposase [Caballeronia sordidicola]